MSRHLPRRTSGSNAPVPAVRFNPSIERTYNGGRPCAALRASRAPLFAAHVERCLQLPSPMPKTALMLVVASCALVSPSAFSREVAKGFNCPSNASPEKIVNAFIQGRAVDATPFDSADAVASFTAKPEITAFGLPLVAIVAWEENSKLFGRGPGTAPPVHFALVVHANPWEASNALRKQGVQVASGTATERFPHIRVESHNSEYPDAPPKSASGKYAYTRISCHPRP
jgi:hypothetical protein